MTHLSISFFFFFNDTATTEIYTLSLHDALPILVADKTYTVTPASVTVKARIVTGEVTEMKVTERVAQGSDRVVSPAKLTGTLKLKNTSTNQTVRLVAGKILYIDAQGQEGGEG